ncbi:ParB/RepB/Spo0J family partition protein [Variovorax sp. J22R24]|uniref:ParB/RepB/Spo0J family partition protein n=1 Tax=Variovorax gracilis TaxID=3053502 RepID=UPI0025788626|nr:ParB/RepB/Spo0J family partition protein [Variovorax sp. J22R24]MDM0108496.1 ParB/RepB/Spo0J family partition protein [Variovorax sp. J22R24]
MLAFMTEQSEVHREVVHLRERLAQFDGAQAMRKLDPKLITASRWANRDASHFQTEAFTRLKEDIAGAGGNVQPIKVRPIAGAPSGAPQFEVVFGHRRHQACLELGIPVQAVVEPDMKDVDLFVEMERENREREDLSAWEQGVMYMRALEQGLFPSAKQLAAAIDRDLGNIGKAMALAKLPSEVVHAFGSPLNLQFRWATALKDAHQRDPEGLLAAAREMATKVPAATPAEVFATLTGAGRAGRQGETPSTEWTDDDGRRIAVLTIDRKGRATLSFDRPLDESQRRRLAKAVDAFVGRKA